MKKFPPKTIVIVGPTASGKSDLAIALARQYDGEIISADSRQVYRGMDIGSGKITRSEQKLARHWLIDVASPKREYNVTHFVRDAKKASADIRKRGKVPIICGGTGFWVQTLIEGVAFPSVKPDKKLRQKLSKKSAEALFAELAQKDPVRAKTIDPSNAVRLIRALEICAALGTVPLPEKKSESETRQRECLIIALNPDKEILKRHIAVRLTKRLKKGMLAEVKRLHEGGVSWQRLESFGLEYKYVAFFLQKKITREEMQTLLTNEIWHYAKRQITWLKRFEKMGIKIHWITDPKQAFEIIEKDL